MSDVTFCFMLALVRDRLSGAKFIFYCKTLVRIRILVEIVE